MVNTIKSNSMNEELIDPIDKAYPDEDNWYKEMIRRHDHVGSFDDENKIVYTEKNLIDIVNIAIKDTENRMDTRYKLYKKERNLGIFFALALIVLLTIVVFVFFKLN